MARVHITCKLPEQPTPQDGYPSIMQYPGWPDVEVHLVNDDGSKVFVDGVRRVSFEAAAGTEPSLARLELEGVTCDLDGVQLDGGRGSGRTHRMVQKAVDAAELVDHVLIVAAHEGSADDIQTRIRKMATPEAVKRVVVTTLKDLEKGYFRGSKFDRCFEDHLATETRMKAWNNEYIAPIVR